MGDRVRFVFTGDAEQEHFAAAVARRYPAATVEACATQLSSFTSMRLAGVAPRLKTDTKPESRSCTLAAYLVNELREHPDALVVVLDDVELENANAETGISSHFAQAIELVLAEKVSSESTRQRYRQALRTRASLHLLRPMLEAYFFAHDAALAGVGATLSLNRFDRAACDVEEFAVLDDAFNLPADVASKNRFRHAWAKANRARHPKHYVRYLRAPHDPSGETSRYHEVEHGGAALQALEWSTLTGELGRSPFLRAMFDDLDDWLLLPRPLLIPEWVPTRRRDDGLLRNIAVS